MLFRHKLGWVFVAKLIQREVATVSDYERLFEKLCWIQLFKLFDST